MTARWRPLQTGGAGALAWSEQWQNGAGDVVMYGFNYAVSTSGHDPAPDTPLAVHVYYLRAETARLVEEERARGDGTVQK